MWPAVAQPRRERQEKERRISRRLWCSDRQNAQGLEIPPTDLLQSDGLIRVACGAWFGPNVEPVNPNHLAPSFR